MVSAWSIVFMVFSLLLSLALVFGLYLLLRKRYGLKIIPALVGAAVFIVFAMVLEQLLHSLVLKKAPDGSIELLKYPLQYVLYGAFAAGIFEETGRFVAFKLLKRKFTGVSTALSYGIGHGGIEVLLLVTLLMISNIVTSIMINTGTTNLLGDTPQVVAGIEQLTTTEPWMFLMGGIERIFAMAMQISLSIIVWHSINTKGKVWLFPLAICIHAAVDVMPAMYQCGVVPNILLVELVTGIIAAILVIFTISAHKKFPKSSTS